MIKNSELIINNDGSIFHLHLKPEELAQKVILVGDPGRVDIIAGFFEHVESGAENREFKSVTGWFNNQRITALSTGIGTDNIDIVLNELDALANIDFATREIKKDHVSLEIVRIGTSGGLQAKLEVGSFVVSRKAIGFDGLLNFYAGRIEYTDRAFEVAFKQYTNWHDSLPSAYIVDSSNVLFTRFSDASFQKGVTISAPGFYGPQGRVLRLPLAFPLLNRQIEEFEFDGHIITNFEMECSAIYGLSKMLGHKALTVCLIIANRVNLTASKDYQPDMLILIEKVLQNFTK
jgi:uridine phosphorylase